MSIHTGSGVRLKSNKVEGLGTGELSVRGKDVGGGTVDGGVGLGVGIP